MLAVLPLPLLIACGSGGNGTNSTSVKSPTTSPSSPSHYAYLGSVAGIEVLDLKTNTLVSNIPMAPYTSGESLPTSPIAITPDGKTLFAIDNSSFGALTALNLATGAATSVAIGNPATTNHVYSVASSPNGKTAYVVAASAGYKLIPIDVATGIAGKAFPLSSGTYGVDVSNLVISPDGKTAYVGLDNTNIKGHRFTYNKFTYNTDGNLFPIDLTTDTLGTPIPLGGAAARIDMTNDGKTIYVSANYYSLPTDGAFVTYGTDVLVPVDVVHATVGAAIPTPMPVNGIGNEQSSVGRPFAITPDGKTAFIGVYAIVPGPGLDPINAMVSIDIATGKAQAPIQVGNQPYGIGLAPDGKTAYVTAGDGLVLIDLATRTASPPIATQQTVYDIVIH